MRVLIANWTSRRVAGAETYLARLIPLLAHRGHEVALLFEGDEPGDREPLAPDPPGPRWTMSAPSAGLSEARAWRPDVVYAHGLGSPALESALLDLAPAVLFAHSYYGTCISGLKTLQFPTPRPCPHRFTPLCLVRYYPRRTGGLSPMTLAREYRRQRARLRLLTRYRMVVTHSEHMRREMVRHGVSEHRARRIDFLVPPATGTAAPPPTEGQPWHLLFVGRMERLKGGHLVLETMPRLADTLRRVHLTFVGDGPERTAWQSLAARSHGADPRITVSFEGWLGAEGLERAYRHAHLLVVPSIWPEPFGTVGPEAGHRGLPAAAFAAGGIPEWLTDGVNGFLAGADPPRAEGLAQAVLRCVRDPATYAGLCAGARTAAARFAPERHVTALLEAFEAARG